MRVSNRLVYRVASPWALRRRGAPTAYLSTWQAVLLTWVNGPGVRRGDVTLAEICRAVGQTSRGQVSRELRRLRHLELASYRTRRGRDGWHRFFPARSASRLRSALAGRRLPRVNDSVSTPYGGFISAEGVRRAWQDGSAPPRRRLGGGAAGPRRGHDPPRVLYGTCPQGHRSRLGRRTWRVDRRGMSATWSGRCARCDRDVVEQLRVELVEPPARPRSPLETSDPSLLDRRRRIAAELLAGSSLPLEVRERIRRDYMPAAQDLGDASRGDRP